MQLTALRDQGTGRDAAVVAPPSAPSTPGPGPSEVFTGRHKAVHEETGFSGLIGVAQVEQNILYGVREDGDLIWHRHFIDFRSNPPRHSFEPTKRVGNGWRAGHKGAYAAGYTGIYSLTDDGELRLHWHIGAFTGKYEWRQSYVAVANGWDNYKEIIPMDHGVVYQLTGIGILRWTKYWDYERGGATGIQAWHKERKAPGHWPYQTVFSGGEGVLYGIHFDGRLMWHKHVGYQNGSDTWLGPIRVGDGWSAVTKIFSPGKGHIYAVQPNGDLTYYRHLGWETGKYVWDEKVQGKIAEGWYGYAFAFARMITGDPAPKGPK
jgi:hypothetical protein